MDTTTRHRTRLLAGVALLLAVAAALAYSPLLRLAGVGSLFAVTAVGLGIAALTAAGGAASDETEQPPASLTGPVGWWSVPPALIALWMSAEGAGPHTITLPGGVTLAPMATHAQAGLFAAGVLLLAWGPGGMRHRLRGFRLDRDGWLLAGVTLLALALRVWDLENAVHMFVDEMHFAEGVAWLRDHPRQSLYTPMGEIAAFSWFQAYLQTHTTALFGSTLTGLRVVSAVLGALTVPAVYLLARHLFDRPTGLLAALTLAAFPPHIHLSRLALNNVADPLFGTLALALLLRGLRVGAEPSARRGDLVLAGLCLGMTGYWYEGGKLVYPAVMLAALLGYGLFRHTTRRRPQVRDLAWLLAAALLVAGPGIYALATWGEDLLPRLSNMRLGTSYWEDLLLAEGGLAQTQAYWQEQVAPALLHFVTHPDGGQFYYGGATALVLPYLLPLLLFGVARLMWQRDAGGWALLLLLALTVFGNSLLTEPDWTARFAVTLPVLALLIAAGGVALWRLLLPTDSPALRRSVPVVALALMLLPQVAYYFGPHLALYNRQIRPFFDHQDVGWRAADLAPGTKVYLLTDDLTFFPHIEGMERFWGVEIDAEFVPAHYFLVRGVERLPRGRDIAFFLKPDDRETLHYLAGIFDLPPPQFSPYNVPPDRQYALFLLRVGG